MQTARLRPFLRVLLPIVLAFGVLDLAVAIVASDRSMFALTLVVFGFAFLLVLVRALVKVGRVDDAIALLGGAIVLVALVAALIRPHLYPALLLAPMVVVALALSFAEKRGLRTLIAASWLGVVAIAAIGIFLPPPFGEPAWYGSPLLLVTVAVGAGLPLLLLWQFNERLSTTINQVRSANLELRSATERLRELDRLKTQFLNTAAHELNTPLTPIQVQLHMLETDREEPLTDRQRQSVRVLDRSLDRLNRLVRDILDTSRLQTGRFPLTPSRFDLEPLLAEAVLSFRGGAEAAGITLSARASPGLWVEADAQRVSQVIDNLLTNAIKFTPKGGRIDAEAFESERGVAVRVRDSGEGLTETQMKLLFQPFSQVHDPMRRTRGGTGLGLYVSRGIVEHQGGRIWCESAGVGKGSTFCFWLPTPAAQPVSPTIRPDQVTRTPFPTPGAAAPGR